jgi:hypothetical protein
MILVEKNFLIYKLLNSSFTGLSIGILFTIYEPLDPEIYSVGGMILAGAMLVVAKFYEKLLNIRSFYWITLLVEMVMLLTIVVFFALQYSLTSALLIYCGYQLTFIFGGYLVRAETLVAHRKELLSKIDVNKQVGYLVGLGASFIFYKALDLAIDITEPKEQIAVLHYFLMLLQSIILIIVLRSFRVD